MCSLQPLKYAPTTQALTSKGTLIKVPKPGTSIKVPLETATPRSEPKARLLAYSVLPSAFKTRSDGLDPNFQEDFA